MSFCLLFHCTLRRTTPDVLDKFRGKNRDSWIFCVCLTIHMRDDYGAAAQSASKRAHVEDALSVLDLPDEIRDKILSGERVAQNNEICSTVSAWCQATRCDDDMFRRLNHMLGWTHDPPPGENRDTFYFLCSERARALTSPNIYLKALRGRHPAYKSLSVLAVQRNGGALEYVPTNRADFGEIARLAVQRHGGALLFVLPTDRADYGEIAKLAVQGYGHALEYVPTDRADYGEIAKLAVQQHGIALCYVPPDRTDYGEIAKLAVQRSGRALDHVPTDRADYGELAALARRAVSA